MAATDEVFAVFNLVARPHLDLSTDALTVRAIVLQTLFQPVAERGGDIAGSQWITPDTNTLQSALNGR